MEHKDFGKRGGITETGSALIQFVGRDEFQLAQKVTTKNTAIQLDKKSKKGLLILSKKGK